MKKIHLKFALLLVFILANAITKVDAQTVYTTNTGEKYHKTTCRYLAKSKIETTVSEASSEGYTPCSVCKPAGYTAPSPAKNAVGGGRCQATTKAGTQCKRNAASGSSRCWQH